MLVQVFLILLLLFFPITFFDSIVYSYGSRGFQELLVGPSLHKTTPLFYAEDKKNQALTFPLQEQNKIEEENLEEKQTILSEEESSPTTEIVSDTPGPENLAEGESSIDKSEESQKNIPDPGKSDSQFIEQESPWENSSVASNREDTLGILDKGSLLAKITATTSARRAASLRLTEEGKKHLGKGSYDKALDQFEKSITIDSTNPYSYYYLAVVHYRRDRYQDSFNFLDVAESLMSEWPDWLSEIFAMRGKNFQAMGLFKRTDASYADALRLDPTNFVALEGISQLNGKFAISSQE